MDSLLEKLDVLKKNIEDLEKKLNLSQKTKDLRQLEADSMKSDFWQDINSATATMEKISFLKSEIEEVSDLMQRINSSLEIAKVPSEAEVMKSDIESEIAQISKKMEELEFKLFLTGKFYGGPAILSIHAGQGGTEAMDWALMLQRMYLRYAEKKGWKSFHLSETKGEEAGIKSASIEITGDHVYGYLRNEAGTHRLVRQSPFNADKLRQTSFALVEVLPVIENVKEIEISPDDLEIDTFKSSGPGGQNVQKVETAVRVRHRPSGIVISAQSERSQAQNKENALKLLRSKLYKLEEEKREKEERKLKGEYKTASWGNQIRNYILHPYKLVKDLRTNVESNDPQSVLDGELDEFIEAEIKLK